MTQQRLETAHRTISFRAFAVHMADGHRFEVRHPDFLSVAPSGRTVIVYEEGEEFSILDFLLRAEIEMLSSNPPSA